MRQLPRPSRVLSPVQLLPARMIDVLVASACNRLLRARIADGALDLLHGRVIRIDIREPDVSVRLTLSGGGLRPAPPGQEAAATVTALAEDLVLVMAQRVDPDTLFFRRRLSVRGDTALGVAVKNVLDTVDPGDLPSPLVDVLQRAADHVPESAGHDSR